jgi:hypothetical protein
MKPIDTIRAWFTPPAALVLAARELEDAKRGLLSAQSSREYADGMCKYYESKIKRLNSYLKEAGE